MEPINSQEDIAERSILTGFVIGTERRAKNSVETLEASDECFVIDACEYPSMRNFLMSLIEKSLGR